MQEENKQKTHNKKKSTHRSTLKSLSPKDNFNGKHENLRRKEIPKLNKPILSLCLFTLRSVTKEDPNKII